jgi:Flp pilus assembly protein TadG
MAIVLPVMMMMIFGMIDFGRVVHQQIRLTEAVREGARVGALAGTTTDVQNRVRTVTGTGVTLTYPTLTVCTSNSGTTATSMVTARHTFHAATPVFHIMRMFGSNKTGTMTLSATGVMACFG